MYDHMMFRHFSGLQLLAIGGVALLIVILVILGLYYMFVGRHRKDDPFPDYQPKHGNPAYDDYPDDAPDGGTVDDPDDDWLYSQTQPVTNWQYLSNPDLDLYPLGFDPRTTAPADRPYPYNLDVQHEQVASDDTAEQLEIPDRCWDDNWFDQWYMEFSAWANDERVKESIHMDEHDANVRDWERLVLA